MAWTLYTYGMAKARARETVIGARGGYLTTQGAPRYSFTGGKHYVVGRGKATECEDTAEAYALRDRLLAAEAEKRKGRPTRKPPQVDALRALSPLMPIAPPPAGSTWAIGAAVKFLVGADERTGTIEEVGARTVAVRDAEGNTWRRTPQEVWT